MSQDVNAELPPASLPSEEKNKRLFYSTLTLSNFLRTYYGSSASQEAQRRVTAYTRRANFEIAEIWKRVLEHLHGFKNTGDTRYIVKTPKPFKVQE